MKLEGVRLLGWSCAALAAMTALLLAVDGTGEEGLRVVVRATARTSLLFFAPAFAATGLRRLWRAPASAWLVRNRRYLGLSFAFSHAIHLAAILAMAATVPGFAESVSTTTAIGGGTAYAFIAAMALTSNDASARWLGRKRWRALHVTGMWVIFAIFTSSYGGRASHNPNYGPHAAVLAAALVIRLWPSRARVD